ncbi:MAG: hypothetical protein O3A53_06565 [Acidobacteria bacterium]|nr:hypothetical protein [Acidobacteriota bacterium]MDA1234444.1 hypothetical protein [Acidobacteriota bacterium]
MSTIRIAGAPGVATLMLLLAVVPARAQMNEGPVQFHGFFTQGYAISDHNNYLTMNTSQGTAQMTDGGLNLTWQVNDKLRVGAQVYDRYIGDLGKGRVSLDWALVDYRFRDWLGFRAGRVKTPLGLFNDSQDQEFSYTWALLPQAVYPLDLRETYNAHTGGDLYGAIPLGRKGYVSYQMYAGTVPSDYRTGFLYGIEDAGFRNVTYSGRTTGYDLRWTTPVSGLMAGVSQSFSEREYEGELAAAPIIIKGKAKTYFSRQTALYAEFVHGPWRLDAEYRAWKSLTRILGPPPLPGRSGQNTPGWFAALSYRVSKLVEIGAYRSQYKFQELLDPVVTQTGPGANHVDDTTVTIRLDPTPYWNIKVEGHFIDGFGSVLSARGFYPRYHPQGIQPNTNMLVVRTGIVF